MSVAGKVAWVTGAGRGIGRAIALELAARGAKVLVTGKSERTIGEAVGEIAYQGGVARHFVANVCEPDALEAAARRAVELWGSLDIVVANAGIGGPTPLADDPQRAVDVVQTNLLGTIFTFRAAALAMTGPGSLIALSSVLGKVGVGGHGAYCASKAGILGLVRASAIELAPRKITVNALCPGWTDTDMAFAGFANIASQRGVSERDAKLSELAKVPLGRLIEPEEVARVAAFLAGPDAAGITGQAISVCGGFTAIGA